MTRYINKTDRVSNYKLDLMTFMQLYDSLSLGYEEIQELKNELNTKEC